MALIAVHLNAGVILVVAVFPPLLPVPNKPYDDGEVMLNVLRCQLTY